MYVLCMYYVKVPQLLEKEKIHLEAALKHHALDSNSVVVQLQTD